MLTKSQEKLLRQLHSKKGRLQQGLCIVEGKKVIDTAGDALEWTFTSADTEQFASLVTTDTPQDIAGVARIPQWSDADIGARKTIVLLAGVQDPGNVGTILRLCLGFDASLLLVNAVDVTNSKVVRSSVGALFHVPWKTISVEEVDTYLAALQRPVFRLEHTSNSQPLDTIPKADRIILVAGSEGNGITLPIDGQSIHITHDSALESLNVASAVAIALYGQYHQKQ